MPTRMPTSTPTPTDYGGGNISSGEIIESSIDFNGDIDEWEFTAYAPSKVTIAMNLINPNDNLNLYLELIGAFGTIVASDVDFFSGDIQIYKVQTAAKNTNNINPPLIQWTPFTSVEFGTPETNIKVQNGQTLSFDVRISFPFE